MNVGFVDPINKISSPQLALSTAFLSYFWKLNIQNVDFYFHLEWEKDVESS